MQESNKNTEKRQDEYLEAREMTRTERHASDSREKGTKHAKSWKSNFRNVKKAFTGRDAKARTNRVIAAGLAGLLVAGTVFAGTSQIKPTEVDANTAAKDAIEKDYPELLKSPNSTNSDKNEVIYTIMDADSNIQKIIGEEQLKNGKKKDTIKDYSLLTDIENTSGDESFEQKGRDITWAAKGSDINYKGTFNGELPVDVKVTYYLDGTRMDAADMAGKKGNVEIHFDYVVDDKDEANGYTMYHPYMIVSALVLDNEHFADVEISDGGKVINDGNNSICAGVSMPGMNYNLNIDEDDLNIPDNCVVKAYTDNFSIDGTYTVVTSGLLKDADADVSDLEDMVDELEDSLGELSKASDKLVSGAETLANGVEEYSEGVAKLKDGSETAAAGAKELNKGLKTLSANSKTLRSGTSQIEDSIFETASSQISEKLGDKITLTPGNYKKIIKGIPDAAVQKAENTLRRALAENDEPVTDKDIQTQILSLAYTMLDDKTSPTQDEIQECVVKAGEVAQKAAVVGEVQSNEKLMGIAKGAVMATVAQTVQTEVVKAVKEEIKAEIENNMTEEQLKATTDEQMNALVEKTYKEKTESGEIDVNSLVQEQLKKVDESQYERQILGAALALYFAQKGGKDITDQSVVAAVLTSKEEPYSTYREQASEYGEAAQQYLGAAEKADEYVDALATLAVGGEAAMKATAKELKSLEKTLDDLEVYVAGVKQYTAGVDSAATGSAALSSGITKMDNGISALEAGAGQIKDGADKLAAGMRTFDKDGIKKLVDSLDDAQLKELKDRFDALREIDSEEVFVGGKPDNMEGESKIIYKTDEIKK